MYFSFLENQVIDWQSEDDKQFGWGNVSDKFIRTNTVSENDIKMQEVRLASLGYHFPEELKAFWLELGCGYLCPNDKVDNGLQSPNTTLDIYFREGDWSKIKLACDIFDQNELPFFLIGNFNYITIGLEEGVNLGKIYRLGEEIAPSLTYFIEHLLQDSTYYTNLVYA